jgi:hypothetical protein
MWLGQLRQSPAFARHGLDAAFRSASACTIIRGDEAPRNQGLHLLSGCVTECDRLEYVTASKLRLLANVQRLTGHS